MGPQWLPPFFRTKAKSLSMAFKASQNLANPFLPCPSPPFQQWFYNRAAPNRLWFVRLHKYTHRSFCSNVPILLSVRLAHSTLFFQASAQTPFPLGSLRGLFHIDASLCALTAPGIFPFSFCYHKIQDVCSFTLSLVLHTFTELALGIEW